MGKSNTKALEENAHLRAENKRLKERLAYLESIADQMHVDREMLSDGNLHV